MQVRFIKQFGDRYRFECVRGDGSVTSADLETRSYLKHDLMHYVIEKNAKLENSFFATVKKGKNLEELSPKAMKAAANAQATPGGSLWPLAPSEINATEIIAAALQGIGDKSADFPEIVSRISEYLELQNLPTPAYLTPDFCKSAVAEHRSLMERWRNLRAGSVLELAF